MPAGRPTLYKEEYCQELIDFMAKGYSYTAFAASIDVNLDSLYEWEKVHPKFSEAKKIAFGKCQLFWESMAINYPFTNPKTGGINTGLWVFNMKNRFKWTDRTEVEAGDKAIKAFTLAYKID